MGRMDDRTVLVTGAGRGIGRATALRLAGEGARVAVTDLDGDTAAATAAELGGAGTAYALDVADPDAVRDTVERVRGDLGRIDVLINNAGWDKVGAFVDSDPADWDRIVRINLFGVLHTAHAVVPHLIAQGSGTVVNLASEAGRVGSSGEAVYSAAKGGVIAFTKTLAREVARVGLEVLPRPELVVANLQHGLAIAIIDSIANLPGTPVSLHCCCWSGSGTGAAATYPPPAMSLKPLDLEKTK